MGSLAEIRSQAMQLPQADRAELAAALLDSLDDGVAEAMRRSEELDRDPSSGLSHDELLRSIGRRA